MLKIFVEHPQRVLSRDQLMDLTKGRDADPFDRSIDLQMFSTNLGHGRPYIFPLAEPSEQGSRFRSREIIRYRNNRGTASGI